MNRESRSELQNIVEVQREKLEKYEKKLVDLVAAYQGILKEKAALEASVKVLSKSTRRNESSRAPTGEAESSDSNAEQGHGDDAQDDESEISRLRDQIVTLTSSLATVSEEKSKMQSNYQAQKKQLTEEYEDSLRQAAAEKRKLDSMVTDLEEQIQQCKAKVRSSQHELQREETDNRVMMRELQKLLSDERNAREELEHQLEDSRQIIEDQSGYSDVSDVYEKKLRNMSNELSVVQSRLKAAEENASRPSPLLQQLQKEMTEIKAQHAVRIQKEQQRVKEADDRLRAMSEQSENRVSTLETKLSELSDVVGNYERLRYQDRLSVQRYREQVAQLKLENSAITEAVTHSKDLEGYINQDNLTLHDLSDAMVKLHDRIRTANEKAEKPIKVEELLGIEESLRKANEDLHKRCRQEYDLLKDEFEKYKLRAQSVLKNKSSKDVTSNKELDGYKHQVNELKERVRDLYSNLDEEEKQHREKEVTFRKTITALHDKHKQDLNHQEAEFKKKELELQAEMRRHRDRTVALLAEKDHELEALREADPERYDSPYMNAYRHISSQSSFEDKLPPNSNEIGASSEETVSQLIARTSMGNQSVGEGSLLHFVEEQARKDVEINSLRRQKHSLEMALRELQQKTSMKQEKDADEIEMLKEEVKKHERNRSRESANLEYLKNVLYEFMVCEQVGEKQQMLKAIATILQFSPREREVVLQMSAQSWWSYGSGAHYRSSKTSKKYYK